MSTTEDKEPFLGWSSESTIPGPSVNHLQAVGLGRQVAGDWYQKMKIQPLEFAIKNNLGPGEHLIIKYVSRWKDKGGIEDLQKIIHVAEIMIQLEQQRKISQYKAATEMQQYVADNNPNVRAY